MISCNTYSTPTDTNPKIYALRSPVSDPTLDHSLASALQYLIFTRPDIVYVVKQICLFVHDPREPHLLERKCILHYIQGTHDHGLFIRSSHVDRMVSYFHTIWVGCPTTRYSIYGFCVYLGDNLVSWSLKRQHFVSRSSVEVEYRG